MVIKISMMDDISKSDPEIFEVIKKEGIRIREGLELIPSENYASKAVLQALGNFLNCKYSEGYPKKRYMAATNLLTKQKYWQLKEQKKPLKFLMQMSSLILEAQQILLFM